MVRDRPKGAIADFHLSLSDTEVPNAMLHALYILAFAVLTVFAVTNLVRNMMMLGADARRDPRQSRGGTSSSRDAVAHPEMLDDTGRVTQEPLLVMRSISLQDARQQLEALYDPSSHDSEGNETVDDQG